MLKKLNILMITTLALALFILLPMPKSSAHVCSSYGELYGYWVDCKNHQQFKNFTYNNSSSMNSTYAGYVSNGAQKWNSTGIFNITKTSTYSTKGYIHTYTDSNTSTVAAFYNYSSNSSGHLTKWSIKMNTSIMGTRTAAKNNSTMAHEFGHAIGLNDLYADGNVDKLMYGYSSRTALSPTTKDKTGANKVLGN